MQASTFADARSLARQRSKGHGWLGPSESETGGLAPDRQLGRMSAAEPPMDASGDKENRTYQESADAADHCNGTATGKTIQVCLVPVHPL